MNSHHVSYKAQNSLKTNSIKVMSPFSGKVLPLSQHPQAFFSYATLGPGIMVELTHHKILAPFSGVLLQVKNAGTEFILQAPNGLKVLLNLYIAAQHPLQHTQIYQLNGSKVKQGQPLAYFDLSELSTPILASLILLNGHNLGSFHYSLSHVSAGVDPLLTISKKI